jgi:hypothetical protein
LVAVQVMSWACGTLPAGTTRTLVLPRSCPAAAWSGDEKRHVAALNLILRLRLRVSERGSAAGQGEGDRAGGGEGGSSHTDLR